MKVSGKRVRAGLTLRWCHFEPRKAQRKPGFPAAGGADGVPDSWGATDLVFASIGSSVGPLGSMSKATLIAPNWSICPNVCPNRGKGNGAAAVFGGAYATFSADIDTRLDAVDGLSEAGPRMVSGTWFSGPLIAWSTRSADGAAGAGRLSRRGLSDRGRQVPRSSRPFFDRQSYRVVIAVQFWLRPHWRRRNIVYVAYPVPGAAPQNNE